MYAPFSKKLNLVRCVLSFAGIVYQGRYMFSVWSHLLGSLIKESACFMMYSPFCWIQFEGQCMLSDVCSALLGSFIKERVCLLMCAPICWVRLLKLIHVFWHMLTFGPGCLNHKPQYWSISGEKSGGPAMLVACSNNNWVQPYAAQRC